MAGRGRLSKSAAQRVQSPYSQKKTAGVSIMVYNKNEQ